jgi:hypothetical protein
MPEALATGESISVVHGLASISELAPISKAREDWYPFGGVDTRPTPSNLRYPDRWLAITASTSDGEIVMFSAAWPWAQHPDVLATVYMYWCDRAYMSGQKSSIQASMHNEFMLAQASAIERDGYRGFIFRLPSDSLESQLDRVTSIELIPGSVVLANLNLAA